jgi:sugar lactone lactonase YvrE
MQFFKPSFVFGFALVWYSIVAANPPMNAAEAVVEVLIGSKSHVPEKGLTSELNNPFAMKFADNGALWIVEYEGGRVLSWREGEAVKHVAGDGQVGYVDGPAKTARFNKLHNLAIRKDGSILLSDHLTHSVRKLDVAAAVVSTLTGTGKPGPAVNIVDASAATFHTPIAISLSPDDRSLLIADIGNRVIRRMDLETGSIRVVAGNGQKGVPADGSLAAESPLVDPRAAIQNKSGEIYLIERNGHALRKIDGEGKVYTLAGTGKAGGRDGEALTAQLSGPKHLCFGDNGLVFIADDGNNAVRKYDPETKLLTTVDLGPYQIKRPHGVCVHQGWLYIADSYQDRILRVKL